MREEFHQKPRAFREQQNLSTTASQPAQNEGNVKAGQAADVFAARLAATKAKDAQSRAPRKTLGERVLELIQEGMSVDNASQIAKSEGYTS